VSENGDKEKLRQILEKIKKYPLDKWEICESTRYYRALRAKIDELLITIDWDRPEKNFFITIRECKKYTEIFRYIVSKKIFRFNDNDFFSDPLVMFCREYRNKVQLKKDKEAEEKKKEEEKILDDFLKEDI